MYIFDAMVKNLDSPNKFCLYPRFCQVFINNQVAQLRHHTKQYASHFHRKKVFANLKRVGKDFSEHVAKEETKHVAEESMLKETVAAEPVPIYTESNDLILGEDRLHLNALMELCKKLQQQVDELKVSKATQAKESI
uniref:Uncharacterized protein n=1 Tax=Tanacetum cinerariifolium TaxID=118510 RepID=A0A6L2M2C7_TANCI|nr:hypothetical protein [Tanacetum cinerariifolium]